MEQADAAEAATKTRTPLASFGRVPAVEVDGLVVRYGDLVAVDGLSFTADAGRVTAVLGPDPRRDHAELVRRIGVMLQSGGVYPGIRTREVARLFCTLYGDRQDAD